MTDEKEIIDDTIEPENPEKYIKIVDSKGVAHWHPRKNIIEGDPGMALGAIPLETVPTQGGYQIEQSGDGKRPKQKKRR